MYHGITADKVNPFNKRHLSYKCFAEQIRFLKRNFHIIALEDYFKGNYDYRDTNFVLTFDDGYLNNLIYAMPILEQYKCPATFFITGLNEVGDKILWADFVNIASVLTSAPVVIEGETFKKQDETYYSVESRKSLYHVVRYDKPDYSYKQKVIEAFRREFNIKEDVAISEYWELLNDEQIKNIGRSEYISIGSHGYYHNNLGSLKHNAAIDELKKSKKYLENLTQKPLTQLAYPDGSYSLELIQASHDLGFNCQLGADSYLFNMDEYNDYIRKRNGIYVVESCLNQIFAAVER
jgi:peptidoglycan/xylan/chitin deacetylase (PgdA/CDA1 family)